MQEKSSFAAGLLFFIRIKGHGARAKIVMVKRLEIRLKH